MEGRKHHRASPLIYKDLLVTSNAIDGLVAYNRQSGQKVWDYRVLGGSEAGPILFDGRLYLGSGDGSVVALVAETGQVVWSSPIRMEGLALAAVGHGRVYVLSGSNTLHALGLESGESDWTYSRKETLNLSIRGGSQPLILGGSVILGFSDGYLVSLNSQDGGVQWERQLSTSKQFTDVDAAPVVAGNRILVSSFDGTLFCLNREDGQVVWRFDEGGFNPVTVVQDRVYFATVQKRLVALDLSSGQVIWERSLEKGNGTQVLPYKGYLLLAQNDGPLQLRDPDKGQVLTEFWPGRGSVAAPSIDEEQGRVYLLSRDANVYALSLERRTWRSILDSEY